MFFFFGSGKNGRPSAEDQQLWTSPLLSIYSTTGAWDEYFARTRSLLGLRDDQYIDLTKSNKIASFAPYVKSFEQLPFKYSDLKIVTIDTNTFSGPLASEIWSMAGSGFIANKDAASDSKNTQQNRLYTGSVFFIYKAAKADLNSDLQELIKAQPEFAKNELALRTRFKQILDFDNK
jgi:hypothetical protein